MKIEILQLIEGARQARGLTVIIDVFRAMTVESFLMARGAQKLLPVGDVQIAWDYKASHPDTILCGERGGAMIGMPKKWHCSMPSNTRCWPINCFATR